MSLANPPYTFEQAKAAAAQIKKDVEALNELLELAAIRGLHIEIETMPKAVVGVGRYVYLEMLTAWRF